MRIELMNENGFKNANQLAVAMKLKDITIDAKTIRRWLAEDERLSLAKEKQILAFLTHKDDVVDYADSIVERDVRNIMRASERASEREEHNFQLFTHAIEEAMLEQLSKPRVVYHTHDRNAEENKHGMLCLSDWHYGIRTEQARENFEEMFDNFLHDTDTDYYTMTIALMGDFSNLDIHADKRSSFDMEQVKGMMHAVEDFRKLVEVAKSKATYVRIIGVVGNESRHSKTFSALDSEGWNNNDCIIFQFLKQIYKYDAQVKFYGDGNDVETTHYLGHRKFYLSHGYFAKKNKLREFFEVRLHKFQADYGIIGHYHNAEVHDRFAVNGALAPMDEYADRQLNLLENLNKQLFVEVLGNRFTTSLL